MKKLFKELKGGNKDAKIIIEDNNQLQQFKIKHFSHPHELKLIEIPNQNQTSNCSGCQVYLFGPCYTCSHCNFFLHKSCFDLPPTTTHLSHPKHTLTLLPAAAGAQCDSCGDQCEGPGGGLTYACRRCNFYLHSRCARLLESEARDDHERYFMNFLKRILVEQKKLVALLQPMMARVGSGQPVGYNPTQQELTHRRIRMYNQQLASMAGSQNHLSIVGTTSYEFARNNNNYYIG